MQKPIKRMLAILLCMLIMTTLVPQYAFAISQIDTEKKIDFTVSFTPEGTPAKGVLFNLYKIATVDENGAFTVTQDYKDYPIDFSVIDDTTYTTLSTTLPGYILGDKLLPDYSAKTNTEGKAFFEQIDQGLYLVMGATSKFSPSVYLPESIMICLPNLDEMDVWQYVVSAEPKYETRPDNGKINIEAIKVWDDDGYIGSRSNSVTVQLYDGTKLCDTKVLNQDNNWNYTWNNLDSSLQWTVKELTEINGYTVAIERTGNAFVIYNTMDGGSVSSGSGSSSTPEKNPDEPGTSSKPDTPGTSSKPDTPGTSSKPDTPGKPGTPEKLPQTGMLWWPIPVLAAVGLLFVIIGISRRRRSKSEN